MTVKVGAEDNPQVRVPVYRKSGGPAVGAQVTVSTGGATATVYSDPELATVASNPLTADSDGVISFYAPQGTYSFTCSDSNVASIEDREVVTGGLTAAHLNGTYGTILAAPAYGRSNAATLMSKLVLGQESANLTFLGDSTGHYQSSGTYIDWIHVFVTWLAAQFPAYTVNLYEWNDTNQNYDAATVVQTGTGTGNGGGPFVLNVYNGSEPGASPAYSRDRVALQVPAAPDCLIINYGKNLGVAVASFEANYLELVCAVRATFPNTPMIFSGQSPDTSPVAAATIALQYTYQTRIREMAGQEGASFLPVSEAFLADPRGVAALTNPADGIHPNADGFTLWAQQAERMFGSEAPDTLTASRAMAPLVPLQRDAPIFIPGSVIFPGTVVSGFPVVQQANGLVAILRYSKAASKIGGPSPAIEIPAHWRQVNITLLWNPTDATAGGVAWLAQVTAAAVGSAPSSNAGSPDSAEVVTAAPGVAYQVTTTKTHQYYTPPSTPFAVRVFRDCANASDTYATYADLIGILIQRAA